MTKKKVTEGYSEKEAKKMNKENTTPENKKFQIKLSDGTFLTTQANLENDYCEICIFLKDKDGVITQDLAIVREKYEINSETAEVKPKSGEYEVIVYADEQQEDYTHKFDVKKYIEPKTVNISATVEINGITLLSRDEFEAYKEYIPEIDHDWWLRSPSHFNFKALFVSYTGNLNSVGRDVTYSDDIVARPALKLLNHSGLEIGDEFKFKNKKWIIIADDLAICKTYLTGDFPFRFKHSTSGLENDYETSDIKRFIETWFNT